MKLFNLLTHDPKINLSSEFYILTDEKYKNDDIVIFWKNKNTIVIGKNQNIESEVNLIFAKENNVNIVRRFSGGGAVYQDDGNCCFTFIKRNQKNSFEFKKSLNDIIEFFKKINLNATFSGRNDILLDNKKISGNAVYFFKNDYMIHGTLLFDLDIEKMVKLLSVDKTKLISKGIESIKSRVTNIKNYYSKSVDNFYRDFINFFEDKYKTNCKNVNFENNENVSKINNERFGNKNWIYGRNLESNFINKIKTKNGLLQINLFVENNKIKDLQFFSDSLLALDINEFRNYFINQEWEIENIKKISKNIDLNQILEDLTEDELIQLFFKNN